MRGDRLLLVDKVNFASLLRKVLPTVWSKLVRFAILSCNKDLFSANNFSNLRDWNACNAIGNAASARHGKEQFIVFSPVQREAQINFLGRVSDDCLRN